MRTSRDWTDVQFVTESMNHNRSGVSPHLAVALFDRLPEPQPTAWCNPDVVPEELITAFFDLAEGPEIGQGITVQSSVPIMVSAETVGPKRFFAVFDDTLGSVRVGLSNRVSGGHSGSLRWRWSPTPQGESGARKLGRQACRRPSISYARYQHERLDLKHPRGGYPKYLWLSLLIHRGEYMRTLATSVLETGPAEGMKKVVEAQDRKLAQYAPVLFNNLRDSGNPQVFDNGAKIYDRPARQPRMTKEQLKALRRGRNGGGLGGVT